MNSLRSFRALDAFANGLGFRFTEAEFRDAGEVFAERAKRSEEIRAEHAAKLKRKGDDEPTRDEKPAKSKKDEKPVKEAKSSKKAAAEPAEPAAKGATADDDLPDELEEERTGNWPDPTGEMAMAYLRRMANAYDVKYDGDDKLALIQKIEAAMYGD